MDFTHQMVRFHRPKEKTAEEYRNVTLFRTKFVNSSSKTQRYTFRTERQTKSSCSLSVQKGYTLGATTNLELALPTNAAPGVNYTKINCHLLLARIFSSYCSRSQREGGSMISQRGAPTRKGSANLLFIELFLFYCIKRKTIGQ